MGGQLALTRWLHVFPYRYDRITVYIRHPWHARARGALTKLAALVYPLRHALQPWLPAAGGVAVAVAVASDGACRTWCTREHGQVSKRWTGSSSNGACSEKPWAGLAVAGADQVQ